MKRESGFTLIELMIVVAIIGILSAIAIPNFVKFQLRSKTSEAKVNLKAIVVAEDAYYAEFGTYVPNNPSLLPGLLSGQKVAWEVAEGVDRTGFNLIGWEPAGDVYFAYAVATNATNGATTFTADAMGDIDNDDALFAQYGYTSPVADEDGVITTDAPAPMMTVCDNLLGTMDFSLAVPLPALHKTVGPCDVDSGQTVF
ncbi:MAG: prepilin-type N-terminal cleavage/methylation domain-containing protein [Deltaproteobacteria bacterium]|nr:prepilin-type N-terminal cleavage/methylation domain-containing protein [Deltaproteobacteria bacterium]